MFSNSWLTILNNIYEYTYNTYIVLKTILYTTGRIIICSTNLIFNSENRYTI